MKAHSLDTYGARLSQYQRRESMTIWVAAGIAALVVVVNVHALDRAHRIFAQIILTCNVLAGGALALARVGFEWRATQLKRKIEKRFWLQYDLLIGDDDDWPGFTEFCWRLSLSLIVLAWIIMLAAIWWPLPQANTSAITSPINLTMSPIGSVGPFIDCSADSSPAYEGQLDLMVKSYHDRLGLNPRAALIILVGAADNRRLAPNCAKRFGTNEQLALSRANQIRARLQQRLSGECLQPSYAVFASGPRHLEANADLEGRQQDRAVNAWVVADTLEEKRKVASGTP